MPARRGGTIPAPLELSRSARTMLLAVVALLSSVTPLGTDMYLPAFPTMAHQLDTTTSGIQSTLTAYMVGLTLGQLVWGPVSDRYGRRGPLLAGTAVATAATLACAIAPTLTTLVTLRLVQGISCAVGLVLGRAVVSDIASGHLAARMFAILMTLVSVAPIVAPLFGGAIFNAAGWRAVFIALTIATAAMLVGVALAVPETNAAQRRAAAQSNTLVMAAATVVSHRPYVGYALSFGLAYGGLFCYVSGNAFVYQNVLGLTPGENTIAFTGTAALVTVTSGLSARLVRRIHPHRVLHTGLIIMTAAALTLSLLASFSNLGLFGTLTLLAVYFLGLGLVVPNATALALDQVPHAAGTGSAVLGALQTGLAAVIAPLIGLAGGRAATPMVLGMTATTATAWLALRLTHRNAAGHVRT